MANEKKRIWDNYKVVGEVRKSESIKQVVAAAVRDGVRYINIREFYLRKKDNVWRPGRDGITIPVEIPVDKGETIIRPAAAFSVALDDAICVVNDLELFDEENAIYMEVKKK